MHHFRKRVEPKLLTTLTAELMADADRFTRSPLIAPRLAPVMARQPVLADPFAWEVAEQEEQLSLLWSAVYAARAELLAVERLISLRAERVDVSRAAVTAAWRWAGARAEAISYTTAFAQDLAVDELVALAGWTPALTPAQASRLTEAAAGGASREEFVAHLHGEPGREIYRKHRERLGRHLLREDRREYSLEVLEAFVAEYTAHVHGIRFYNRGIPDGYGWEGFFGLKPTPELEDATNRYRDDAIFVLDPLDTFEDPDDIM
ncbi:AAA family ATPase [Actinokineospora cianjurensis]|uniref:AAA domain-containing protein n=1 Tax=Actinokineospora cianjurensis TaxID=585224 RepID=A0A421B2H8_9PSEU|nr:AAA family ATPase [Actinokineospora cianjurensis]RLK58602.1 AAA domain-containing protein [Actinokineospora cianjurensis]